MLAVHAIKPPKEGIATPSSSSASLMRPLGKGDKQGQSKRVSATSPCSFPRQTMISCCERCLLCLEIHFFLPVPSCLPFPGRLQTLMVITNTSEGYSADLAPAKTFFFSLTDFMQIPDISLVSRLLSDKGQLGWNFNAEPGESLKDTKRHLTLLMSNSSKQNALAGRGPPRHSTWFPSFFTLISSSGLEYLNPGVKNTNQQLSCNISCTEKHSQGDGHTLAWV